MKHFLVDIRHSSSSPVLCLQTWISLNDIPNLWFMIKIPEDYAELFYTSESLTLTSLVSFDPLTRTIELYLISWKRRIKETTVQREYGNFEKFLKPNSSFHEGLSNYSQYWSLFRSCQEHRFLEWTEFWYLWL